MWSGCSTSHPGQITPGETDSVPILQEAYLAPESVCKGAENLAPKGIPSPGHSARSVWHSVKTRSYIRDFANIYSNLYVLLLNVSFTYEEYSKFC